MRRSLATFLVLILVLSPLQVFAQEEASVLIDPPANTPPAEPIAESAAPESTPAESAPSTEETLPPTAPVEETAPSAESPEEGDEPPPPSLMDSEEDPAPMPENLLTYKNTQSKTDPVTGALTQRLPIGIPPGRAGVQPDLALEYNSQRAEDDIAGFGWGVSIPYIERINKTGSEKLYTDNYFYSSLGGELATSTTSTSSPVAYRHKIENGSFISYAFSSTTSTTSTSWVAYDKEGTRYTFGTTTQARQSDPDYAGRTSKWMLEEIRDTNNNFVRFEYQKDSAQIYPYKIYYTGHDTTDGPFTIEFTRASRPDPFNSYKAGYKITTSYRITEIKASVSGQWVRKYALSYTSGNNGARSLLSSVQETGRHEDTTELSLPAVTFEYASSSVPFYVPSLDERLGSPSFVVADRNGDALNDITVGFYSYSSAAYGHHFWTNTGTNGSFSEEFDVDSALIPGPATWAVKPVSGPYSGVPTAIRPIDIDGDGKLDIAIGSTISTSTTNTVTKIYTNTYATSTGYGWTLTSTTSVPMFAYNELGTGLIGNLNGDILPDYTAWSDYPPIGPISYAGNGVGWAAFASSTFVPVKKAPDEDRVPVTNSQLVDINGDGLDDWVYVNDAWTETSVCLNTGTGWESSCTNGWALPFPTLWRTTSSNPASYFDRGMRFMDINGDGLVDFVRSYKMPSYGIAYAPVPEISDEKYVLLNTGSGWATSTTHGAQLPSYITTGVLDSGNWTGNFEFDEYANWNGNGQQNQDVITKITYPQGGFSEIEYVATAKQIGQNPQLPVSLLVVKRITTDDGGGNDEITDYAYSGGVMYFGDGVQQRKFAGFASTTMSTADTKIRTYYHQGNGTSTTIGEQADNSALIGYPYREDTLSATTGAIFQKKFFRHDTLFQGDTRRFVSLVQELTQDYGTTTDSHRDKAKDYSYATSTGDLLQTIERGEVTGSSDGTYVDSGSDTRFKTITYAASSTLSVPIQEVLTNYASTTIRQSLYYYDGLAYGSLGAGNQTKREDWITGSTYASTTKTYNIYGLVTTETDPRSNQTTHTYDPLNLYQATSTNALGQVTARTYDYATGRVKIFTDANNRMQESVYDPVGRLTAQKIPDLSTPTTLVSKQTIAYTDNTYPTKKAVTTHLTSATSSTANIYFDGLGRMIQERLPAEGDNTVIVKNYVYGTNGQLEFQSLPYFASSTPWSSGTSTPTNMRINYTYDILNRVTRMQDAIGTTLYNFSGWDVTKRDPNRNDTEYGYDAFGNLESVLEPRLSADLPVSYWKLDESSGVREDTQASNDLTDNNTVASATGIINNAADFERGNSEYLSIADGSQSGLDITGDMSISLWVKLESQVPSDDTFGLISKSDNPSNKSFELVINDRGGVESVDFYNTSGGSEATNIGKIFSTGSLTPGTWYHLALTYDANTGTVELFKNNVSQGTGAVNTSQYNGTASLRIGNFASQYFDGLIDEVGIWNRTLSGAEISALYNGGSGQAYSYVGVSTTTETMYEYDAANNLTSITDAVSNERNFTYDGLGRRTTAQDLHATADGTFGTWTYAYDVASNIASTTDPKSQNVVYTYDALNRRLTENYLGQSGTEMVFTYDACTTGVGRLCTASTTVASTTLTYDNRGYLSSENKTIGGARYATIYTRDRQGSIENVLYPNGAEAKYGYFASGRVSDIQTKQNSSAAFVPSLDLLSYAPTNQVKYQHFANGQKTKSVFYEDALYRLQSRFTGLSIDTPAISYPTSTVSHWKFDESSGNASDTVGPNTLTNTASVSYATGKINNGADPERSSSQYFTISDASQTGLDITGDMSISMWLKLESQVPTDDAFGLITKSDNSTNKSYELVINDRSGVESVDFYNTTGGTGATLMSKIFSTGSLTPGVWYHLVLTYASSTGTVELFKNNVSQGTGTVNTSQFNGTAPLNIGNFVGLYYDGLIDEVGIWSRTLSGTEVTQLYNSGAGTAYGTAGGTSGNIQDMSYEYDANGNITELTDISVTSALKTVAFEYDQLNHLTSASTTVASTTPYLQTFTYDALGNMLTQTGVGTYTYAGTNYANPHAPTTIDGTTYAYDNNGNLTSVGSTASYTFDYANRLTQAIIGTATSTYAYDHEGGRVLQTIASTTTAYPNKFYSVATSTVGATTYATTTAYVWLGDTLIGTIDQLFVNNAASGTPTTLFYHPDHLGSTNVITNASSTIIQTLDYYPYGSQRVNTGTSTANRQYIGERYDANTALSYLNARYYDGARGQFLSQDPVFWEVGQTDNGRKALTNPQTLNSYAYANGNPIGNKDPKGRFIESGFDLGMLGFSLYQFYQEPSWINAGGVLLDAGSLALPGIPAIGGLALRAGKTADDVAKYSVYALKEGDDIRYIGMTGRDPLLRFSEHARAGSGKEHLSPSIIYSGLTKPQARIIEQLYLNQGGLLKNGGLLNRINSVSPSSRLGQIVSNFSTGQASAVSGLLDAFAPTNATQQKALEGVVSAFGKK